MKRTTIYFSRDMNGDSHAAEVFNRKDAIRRPHLYKVACYDLFSHMILRCYHDAATAAKELNLSIREINVALLKGDKYAGIKWGYIRVDATPKLKKNGVHELRQIISIAAFEASVSKTGSNGRIRQETGNREIAYHPTNPDTFEDEIIFPFDGILDNASNVSTSSTANTGSRRGSPVSGDCIVEDSIVYWMDLPTDRNGSESITAKDEQNDVESLKNLSRHSTDSSGSSSSHKSLHSDDFPLVQLSNASGEEAVKESTLEPFDHQLQQNQVLSSSERSFPFYEPDPETAYYGSHFISREKPYYLRNALGFRLIVEAVQVCCLVSPLSIRALNSLFLLCDSPASNLEYTTSFLLRMVLPIPHNSLFLDFIYFTLIYEIILFTYLRNYILFVFFSSFRLRQDILMLN